MSDSLSLPLEIRHDQIDPLILEAVRKINAVAAEHDTSYFLAGTTAREVILRHVFGRPAGRRTLDIDFGIAVRDWEHFQTLKSALVDQAGFIVHARASAVDLSHHPRGHCGSDPVWRRGTRGRDDRLAARGRFCHAGCRIQRWDGILRAGETRGRSGGPRREPSRVAGAEAFAWLDRKQEKRDAPDMHTFRNNSTRCKVP
jgi:predicted nucleotidyltransferase